MHFRSQARHAMPRHRTRKAIAVAGASALLAAGTAGAALADDETLSSGSVNVVPGQSVTVKVGLTATTGGSDPIEGCDVDATHTATMAISTTPNSKASFSPSPSVEISDCDHSDTANVFEGAQTVTITAAADAVPGTSDSVKFDVSNGTVSDPNGLTESHTEIVKVRGEDTEVTVTDYPRYDGQAVLTVNYVSGTQAGPCTGASTAVPPTIVATGGTAGNTPWWTAAPALSATGAAGVLEWATNSGFSPSLGATAPTLSDGTTSVWVRDVVKGSDSTTVCSTSDAATASYSVDSVAPVIAASGSPSGTAGSNGWYKSDVTQSFSITETGSGLPSGTTSPFSQTSTGEGSSINVVSGTVTDVAGNVSNSVTVGPFKVDKTTPALNITGAADEASFDICSDGAPTRPSFAPTDATSGIDPDVTKTYDSWSTPSAPSGAGAYTYTAHASDMAGWDSTETRDYTVSYGSAFQGFGQPINTTGLPSRFKLGSTIPVKFKLMCGTTPIENAVAKLYVKQGDNQPDPGVDEPVSTAASTTGNLFRYDATAQQYIFNLSTKQGYYNPGSSTPTAFSVGTWTLKIGLDDGTFKSVTININK